MCEHSSRIKGFVLVVARRQADAVGSQQINGLHPAISGFRHWFGFPIPSACNGGSSFLTGIRAVHDASQDRVRFRPNPDSRHALLDRLHRVLDLQDAALRGESRCVAVVPRPEHLKM